MALLQHLRHEEPEHVEVVELSADEYEEAKQKALNELGVTYDDLARQAQERRFSSLRHRKLWLLIREY